MNLMEKMLTHVTLFIRSPKQDRYSLLLFIFRSKKELFMADINYATWETYHDFTICISSMGPRNLISFLSFVF